MTGDDLCLPVHLDLDRWTRKQLITDQVNNYRPAFVLGRGRENEEICEYFVSYEIVLAFSKKLNKDRLFTVQKMPKLEF